MRRGLGGPTPDEHVRRAGAGDFADFAVAAQDNPVHRRAQLQIGDAILLRGNARLVFLQLRDRLVERGLRRGSAGDKAADALDIKRDALATGFQFSQLGVLPRHHQA